LFSPEGRGGPTWPHAGLKTDDPDLKALAVLWESWLEHHKAGEADRAAEVLGRIGRRSVKPAHMFRLFVLAALAPEPELAAAIALEIDYRAAEEQGRLRPRPREKQRTLAEACP
jgi:hypothetical protein